MTVVPAVGEADELRIVAVPAGQPAILADRTFLEFLVALLALETSDHTLIFPG